MANDMSTLKMPNMRKEFDAMPVRTLIQAASINHARHRVTGSANKMENTIPSGVRISKEFVRPLFIIEYRFANARSRQEQNQQDQFHDAKTNFNLIRQDGLMVLREERFDKPRPDEQTPH